MKTIETLQSNNLSYYRTSHLFKRYGEISSVESLEEYCDWARENNVEIYILGNGSNTLFTNKNIKTLILKNKLPKFINELPGDRVEVSSSVLVIELLKYCYEHSFDSFYYLASVPASIGGALAMNAGRGRQFNCTIYDFIETITFWDGSSIKTLKNEEIKRSYRETQFTGKHASLIISAVFRFPKAKFASNPLQERQHWSKEHQDNSAPNCGSVFKLADSSILNRLRGISIGDTSFSSKTNNWILNRSRSSWPILILIWLAKFLHLVRGRKIQLELIKID